VLVNAYSFTQRRISGALVACAQAQQPAGDRRQSAGRDAAAERWRSWSKGASTMADSNYQAAHNKVVIVDADTATRRRSPAATTSPPPHSGTTPKTS
jgi:hypothetical protein